MKKTHILLVFIFLLAFFLRFYKLGEIPYGLHRDEAFLGYNAYSILKTTRDITGSFLPLHFESFLYSPAGYSYFSIPFIALFGLEAFSVRVASALFGSGTVIIIFLFVQELFFQYKTKNKIALFTSILFAFSPWSINLSRTATENTVVTFLIIFASWLFILYVRKEKTLFLPLSFFFFSMTLFIYQAPRAFLPFLIPLLIFCFLDLHKEKKRILFSLAFFFFVIITPLITILFSKELSLRIKTVSLFASHQTQLVLDEQLRQDGVMDVSSFTARYFHNKLSYYSLEFTKNYFKHLSYDFLFTDIALPDRYRVPVSGLMYFFELPLILMGLWLLMNNNKRVGLLLLGWILASPIGSAFTSDDIPNLQRTLFLYPPLAILASYSLVSLATIRRKFISRGIFVVIILGFICGVSYYLHQYYVHVNLYRPWYRHDGYQELVKKVSTAKGNYKQVVMTNRESAPTIFFLFYNKYDPYKFQQETRASQFRDFDRIAFDKYEFSEDECPLRYIKTENGIKLNGKKETLYVNSALCKDEKGIKTIEEIKRKDDSTVFKIVILENK